MHLKFNLKLVSEKLVNDFVAALPEEFRITHAFINPGAIYGPILNPTQVCSTRYVCRMFYNSRVGRCQAAPKSFGIS